MARASFLLRQTPTGSYLQYPPSYDASASAGSYLNVPNTSGAYASTPAVSEFGITGDLEIVVRVSFNSLPASGTYRGIVANQTSATSGGYWLYLQNPGTLVLRWSTGTLDKFYSVGSIVTAGLSLGGKYWIKATIDVDNGSGGHQARAWWAPDSSSEPTSWTALPAPAAGVGVTSIGVSPTALRIGAFANNSSPLDGRFYRCIIRNGIGGSSVFDIDFVTAITSQNQTSLVASTAQTVTVSGTASTVLVPGNPSRAPDDGFLRADGLQLQPILTDVVPGGNQYSSVAFFSVDTTDYNYNLLQWGVPLTAASAIGVTPVATQVVIAYSPDGEPDTVNEGSVVVETTNSSSYSHEVPSGKWAYYTLFLKYQGSAGDVYYEPAAKLSVLTPKDYGSTDILYNHIPALYREMDGGLDKGEGGPLYRYLSIFGWDADRMRTLVEYFIGCRDPANARTEELDQIASELGVPFSSVELGAARLRAFIDDIGISRRESGIAINLSAALSSITGSNVTVDTTGRIIYIAPQRVNLFKDPTLFNIPLTAIDGGAASTTSFSSVLDAAGSVTPSPPPDGGGAAADYGTSLGYWTSYTTTTTSVFEVVYAAGGASVNGLYTEPGMVFYFSVDSKIGESSINRVLLYSGPPASSVEVVSTSTPIQVGGRKYWKLVIPDTATAGWLTLRAEYTATDASTQSLFKNILLEENNIGDFFNGGTQRGGWMKYETGSISDFRWFDPNNPTAGQSALANNAYSVYSTNYQKTKAVVTKMLPYLLPVTELVTSGTVYSNQPVIVNKWTVYYNYLSGYDLSYGA